MFNAEVVDIRSQGRQGPGHHLEGRHPDRRAHRGQLSPGPHSFKINQMADGVWEGCNIKTKALRHEVMYCPSPEGYDYLNDGYHTSDGDVGCYYRPEVGNMFLIGMRRPGMRPPGMGRPG